MSNKNDYGFVPGAVLFLPFIKKLREHVEYEKFLCRVLVDNETTREFKKKTELHPDKIHTLIYNNERTNNLTVEGKANGS